MLHIFIDESGDPGFNSGSSKYFLIGFAYFPNENYKRSIDNIKKCIQTKTGKFPKEIKFVTIQPPSRTSFFLQILHES
jgi:hypothetical protein